MLAALLFFLLERCLWPLHPHASEKMSSAEMLFVEGLEPLEIEILSFVFSGDNKSVRNKFLEGIL